MIAFGLVLQVADCTSADVPPPSDWAAGWHALVLGPGSCGILRLLVQLLERVPEFLSAQVGCVTVRPQTECMQI